MKRLAALALAVTVAAFGAACDDDSPTTPTESVTFTAQLSPANEVPPVANAEASGSGTVSIQLDLVRNAAGTITNATATFQVALTGFPANTPLVGAHIHSGNAGVNGPVEVNTGLTSGQVTLSAGAGNFSRPGIAVSVEDAQNMLNTPSAFYFNVHTVLSPDGVARGQLVRQ